MTRFVRSLRLIAALVVLPVLAHGQNKAPGMTNEEFESRLGFKTGSVTLEGGMATLNLSPAFRFIGPESAKRVLVDAWGNPPEVAEGILGMIFPADLGPLTRGNWAVTVEFSDDGYVDDSDAAKIDYSKLLKEMQEGLVKANPERVKAGYPAITLIGWAEPPVYNAETHKIYWAKELKFGDDTTRVLNYNVRVLGRRGVLNLNAIADMYQLDSIKVGMQQVLGFVEFNEGHRYADYLPGKDKAATYGVAGLVAGAVAAKTGLLKALFAGLLAAKKFIVIGLVAAGAWLKKKFGGGAADGSAGADQPPTA